MEEIIRKYGILVVYGIITVSLVAFLYNSGLNIAIKDAMGITTESNDNMASQSESAMKEAVERELPEIVGNTNIVEKKEYLISYDNSNPTADYLTKTQDANGTKNTSCSIALLSVKNDDKEELYDAKNLTSISTQQEVAVENNKITFLAAGIYEIKVRVSDTMGADYTTTIMINVNGGDEE